MDGVVLGEGRRLMGGRRWLSKRLLEGRRREVEVEVRCLCTGENGDDSSPDGATALLP